MSFLLVLSVPVSIAICPGSLPVLAFLPVLALSDSFSCLFRSFTQFLFLPVLIPLPVLLFYLIPVSCLS